jgi:SAM-dependent methyltransferase
VDSDDRIWDDWLSWLRSAPPFSSVGPAFTRYSSVLTVAGRTEEAARREVDAIVRLMRERTGGWQVLFDNIYSSPTPTFSTAPNALMVSVVDGLTPGRALDLATGQGRNAVYLAREGWSVTAVDISDIGLGVAAATAQQWGVSLATVLGSVDAFDLGEDVWDLVVITYAPVPVADGTYVRRLARALRPGGAVVIESFASDVGEAERRPVDIDPARLSSAFTGFTILRHEDLIDVPEWDPEPTRIVRFAARKPVDG